MKINEMVRSQLLAMSAATIDRRLRSIRENAYGGRKKKRAALNRVRKLVPVRTFTDWAEPRPGFFEMDMVRHFPDGQLRTLQRRVRVWRMQIVKHLVYGTEDVAVPIAATLN